MTVPTAPARHRRLLSLQATLMITVIGIVGMILVGSAVAISASVGRVTTDSLDSQLRASTQYIRLTEPGLPPTVRTADEALHNSQQGRGYLLVVDVASGTTTGAIITDESEVETLTTSQIQQLRDGIVPGEYSTVTVDGVGAFRVAGFTSGYPGVSGIVGLTMEEQQSTISKILWTILLVTIVGLGLLGAAIAVVIRQALKPLRAIAETATRVAGMPLAEGSVTIRERVPAEEADERTEVGRVGAALNTLLDHVDASLDARHRNEERMRAFVADASHELRTPLASIRGYSELSLRALATQTPEIAIDGTTSALERIQAQSLRMTRLVEDLLLLARLDEGQDLVFGAVDITRLAAEAVADAHAAGPDHHWSIDVGDEPVIVAGDASRLHQVVGNLLANARIHTPAGTHVELTLRQEGGDAVLEVSDDGPGIAPDAVATIFERFARADSSRARKTGGTGLGLSIAQAITHAHGGTIAVASSSDGTRFTVRLPARPATPSTASPSASASTGGPGTHSADSPSAASHSAGA